MSVTLDKATGRYHVRIYRGGHYVFNKRLPRGATRKQAEEVERAAEREWIDVGLLGKKPDRLIIEAVEKWVREDSQGLKGRKADVAHLKAMLPHYDGHRLSAMKAVCEGYIAAHAGDLAPATINRRLALLRTIANLAYKRWGWIDRPISQAVRMLPVNNARQVFLSKEEILRIAQACQRPETRALVVAAAWTGLRRGELMQLGKEFPIRPTHVHILEAKNGHSRIVPLVGPAIEAMEAFPMHLNVRTLTRDFDAARELAGLPHVHFHDLRHSCASLLLNAGVSLEVIGQILGHRDLRTTRRYAHLSLEAATEALRKIA